MTIFRYLIINQYIITMKYLYILFVFLSVLIFISCDDILDPDPPSLPEITTEGKGTYGCMVDGELWLPKGFLDFSGNPSASYTELGGAFRLTAKINTEAKEELLNCSVTLDSVGVFPLNIHSKFKKYESSENENYCEYNIDTTMHHQIEILRLDKVEDIISGTFEFTAICEEYQDTVRITDGRFDLNYHL